MEEQHFSYRMVDEDFFVVVLERLALGDNVALLGSRYIGKRHILAWVQRKLEARSDMRVVSLRFLDETLKGTHDLDARIQTELAEALEEFPAGTEGDDNMFRGVPDALEGRPYRLVLLLADIDALPDYLARRVLKGLRQLVMTPGTGSRISTLLTGSAGLTPLVHGVHSDFNSSYMFVLQGYAIDAFKTYAHQMIKALGWPPPTERCVKELWEQSGGNVYLLRVLVWGLQEGRRIAGVNKAMAISLKEIGEAGVHLYSPTSTPIDLVDHVFTRLVRSPDAYRHVEALIRNNEFPVPLTNATEGNAPLDIELSGLAVRRDGVLYFASPILREVAKRYFSSWRLGDFFARAQAWKEAMRLYKEARGDDSNWVYSPVRRPQLPAAIASFQTALLAKAASGLADVEEFFLKGAQYLLGFGQVTFWEWRGAWQRPENCPGESPPPERIVKRCASLLPESPSGTTGIVPVPQDVEHHAMLAGLAAKAGNRERLVLLTSFESETPLTRERRQLCEAAVRSYTAAASIALNLDLERRDGEIWDVVRQAMPKLLDVVALDPSKAPETLEAAADLLRKIGFRRVMFSMVSPDGKSIDGVYDSRPPDEVDLAAMSNWRIDIAPEEVIDVQQKCVLTGEKVLVTNAKTDPLTYDDAVEEAGLKAMVILPITYLGRIIGTFHVEREDRGLPVPTEIEALEYFGSQLAAVLYLMQRFHMLQASLAAESGPIFIVDPTLRIRYANSQAASQSELDAGWQDPFNSPLAEGNLYPASLKTVKTVLRTGEPFTRFAGAARGPNPEWWRLAATPVRDWRDQLTAVVLEAHDLSDMAQLHNTFEEVVGAPKKESLFRRILDATEALEHKWGRLYLIDPESGLLTSSQQYGADPKSQAARDFAGGKLKLPPRGAPGSESWICLDKKRPVVFCFAPGVAEPHTETAGGLIAQNTETECPEECAKEPGEVWIDFPLFCQKGEPLGKLSLHCTKTFTPERLEALNSLCKVAAALLQAMTVAEALAQDQLDMERKSGARAFGRAAHRLRASFAALGTLSARYQRLEEGNSDEALRHLNARLEANLIDIDGELEAIRRGLKPIVADRRSRDLEAVVRRVFENQLQPRNWTITNAQDPIIADVDEILLSDAISELIQNARKAVGTQDALRMKVELSTEGPEGRLCRIKMKDNGPGIPEHLREKVFEELYSDWPKAEHGVGFGLGFVLKVAKGHEGSVTIGGNGSGAEIVITLRRSASQRHHGGHEE